MYFDITPMPPLPPIIVPRDTAADERDEIEMWLLLGLLVDAGGARWQAAGETYLCDGGIIQFGLN